MAKSAIVTGADGFLGRHIVSALLSRGYEVHGFVRNRDGSFRALLDAKLTLHELDLREIAGYGKSFPHGIDCLYHLAWDGTAPQFRDDMEKQLGNIDLSLSCMQFANECGVKRVVFPGSTNEYLFSSGSINGESSPSPSDAYGAAKVAVRYLCSQYAQMHGIEFVYAIVTGVYAPDRIDSNVISYTIAKLLRGERPSLTKCEQLWDYVHVDDATRALLAVGERGKDRSVYAIGHGDNWPLLNYINIIHDLVGQNVPLGLGDVPYKSEVLPSSCVDLSALREDAGFQPEVGFREGIREVIDAMRGNEEGRSHG